MAKAKESQLAEDRQSARHGRLLTWLFVGSLLSHLVLIVTLQPWAHTTMRIDEEENAERAQLVAQREQLRKKYEEDRRQHTPIPERFREQLKEEAERRERDYIKEKIKRMLEDREEAERQRERAFEQIKKRDKEQFIKKHVTPKIEKALEDTQEKVDGFKKAKPDDKKDDKDRELDRRADEIAGDLKKKLKELKEDPSQAGRQLEEIKELAEELKGTASRGRDRGEQTHEPAWELGHKANKIKEAVAEAKKSQNEAEKLHDTSEAADVGEAPEAAKQAAGQGNGQGGEPDAADLYDAARTLEKQTEALVNDARAAEVAKRTETSFGTAKNKLNTHSPSRPDLAPKLRENAAGTVGELNEYRDALEQAGNQVNSMATRTASMTRGVQAVQDRRALTADRAAALAQVARAEGFGDITMSNVRGSGPGSLGSSAGLDAGSDAYAGGHDTPGKQKGDLTLPRRQITANALPGRMLTDASARQGWLYLDTWYVIGPWPVNYKDKFGTPHPPEYEVDFDAIYTDGKFADKPAHPYHEMRWQFIQSDQMAIQPPRVFGGETWYAYTEVYSDKDRDMLLAVASDDWAKVWLNDQVVWEDAKMSAYDPGENLRRVTFQHGYNRVLIRVGNGPRQIAWSVLISPPEVLQFVNQSDAEER